MNNIQRIKKEWRAEKRTEFINEWVIPFAVAIGLLIFMWIISLVILSI